MERKFDVLLQDASSMERNAGTNMNGMGRKSCKILLLGDIVYNMCCLAKGIIDVGGSNEFDRAIKEASGCEYSKGIITWKVKVIPLFDDVKPGRDSTESRRWSHV